MTGRRPCVLGYMAERGVEVTGRASVPEALCAQPLLLKCGRAGEFAAVLVKGHEAMTAREPITGVILAGGLSRRMGGGDKGLLDLGGATMLGRVIDRLRPQVGALVINANGDASRFAAFGLPVVADETADYSGPLAGILAGMRWSLAHVPAVRHIATVSSDAPFLPTDLVARLSPAIGDRPDQIALARSAGEVQPVIGVWPVALADDLQARLAAGTRKIMAWAERHATVQVDFAEIDIGGRKVDPFFNANTPEDLALARTLLGGDQP